MSSSTRARKPAGSNAGSWSPVDSKGSMNSSSSKPTRSQGSNGSSASRGVLSKSGRPVNKKCKTIRDNVDSNGSIIKSEIESDDDDDDMDGIRSYASPLSLLRSGILVNKKCQMISDSDDSNDCDIKAESGSDDDMDAKMDGGKMFKCQECHENYTADGLNTIVPILLDCGHDICRDCAKKLLCDKGVLCCPDLGCKMKHERYPLDSLPIIWALIKRNQNILTSGKSHPSVNNKITVFMYFQDGNNVPLNVHPMATVNDLIQVASNKLGYSLVGIRMIHKGTALREDDQRISDYDIGDKSRIEIIYELRGD